MIVLLTINSLRSHALEILILKKTRIFWFGTSDSRFFCTFIIQYIILLNNIELYF